MGKLESILAPLLMLSLVSCGTVHHQQVAPATTTSRATRFATIDRVISSGNPNACMRYNSGNNSIEVGKPDEPGFVLPLSLGINYLGFKTTNEYARKEGCSYELCYSSGELCIRER